MQQKLWQFIYSQSLGYKILNGKRTTDSVHINISLPILTENLILKNKNYRNSLYTFEAVYLQ